MKNPKLLYVVLALQGLLLAGQWLGQPSFVSTAQAQIPDAGAQRNQMVEELRSLNAKLDRIASLLESGRLEVRTTATEPKAAR